MRIRGSRSLGQVLLLVAVGACSTPPGSTSTHGAASQPASTSAATTTASGRTSLLRSVHPSARPERDDGRMDAAAVLRSASLYFQPSPEQRDAREARLLAVQNPASPVYHQWLTPEQYAARFGATPETVARVSAWLASQGLAVESTSRTGTQLFFTGTVAEVEAAFQTEMHWYRVDGERHFAMSRTPSLPDDVAPLVLGLHNLHSFRPRAPRHLIHPSPDFSLQGTSLGPGDFATIYDLTPLYAAGIDGTGLNVAIAGQTNLVATDYAAFRSTFGLSATTIDMMLVPGSGNAQMSGGDLAEANIDTQWSGGVAKGATVDYVFTGDNPAYSVLDAYAYAAQPGASRSRPVVSISYGGCEQGTSPSDADATGEIAAAANLMGVSLLAASGDSGAADCDYGTQTATQGLFVDIPASLPGVTGVGGLEFPKAVLTNTAYWSNNVAVTYPASNGTSLEGVWNDSLNGFGLAGGGGGKSVAFTHEALLPARQRDAGRRGPGRARRGSSPASSSDAPYVIYDGTDFHGLGGLGGTSCAAPSFAGILDAWSTTPSSRKGGLAGPRQRQRDALPAERERPDGVPRHRLGQQHGPVQVRHAGLPHHDPVPVRLPGRGGVRPRERPRLRRRQRPRDVVGEPRADDDHPPGERHEHHGGHAGYADGDDRLRRHRRHDGQRDLHVRDVRAAGQGATSTAASTTRGRSAPSPSPRRPRATPPPR